MPELPEVETVVVTLKGLIANRMIVSIDVLYPKIIDGDIDVFKNKLINKRFTGFNRKGKYGLYTLEDTILVVHLRMEGRFYLHPSSHPYSKHTHVVFHLDDGMALHYHDTRKFGRLKISSLESVDQDLSHLGIEPLDAKLTAKMLKQLAKGRRISLKAFLLDQRFVAGIGNIYADEICFESKIHPCQSVATCSDKDWRRIKKAIPYVIEQAILQGGTTIRSYTSSLGVSGRFQMQLKVHTLQNQPCQVCQTLIVKIRCAGRGTYLCPQCQKVKT